MTSASDDQFAEEAATKILPCMKTISDFLARFTRAISPAAVGAMSLDVVDDIADTEEEKVGVQVGLASAAYKAFEDFIEPLSPTGKLFATVLYKTHTCSFDGELSAMAAAESNNARAQFPWADLLKPGEVTGETRIAGIPVPLLAQACSKWTQSKNEAAAKVSGSSAVGEEDRIVSEVGRRVQGLADNQDEEEQKRLKTIAQLSEFFYRKTRQ